MEKKKRERIKILKEYPNTLLGWYELFAEVLKNQPYIGDKEIKHHWYTRACEVTNWDMDKKEIINPKANVNARSRWVPAGHPKPAGWTNGTLKATIEALSAAGDVSFSIPVYHAKFSMTIDVEYGIGRKTTMADPLISWETKQMPLNCGAVTVTNTYVNPSIRNIGIGDLFHRFRLWYIPIYGEFNVLIATNILKSPYSSDISFRYRAQQRIFENHGWQLHRKWINPNSDNTLGLWSLELKKPDYLPPDPEDIDDYYDEDYYDDEDDLWLVHIN
jgi:hypothetical protein